MALPQVQVTGSLNPENELSDALRAAINHERSFYSNGFVEDDSFYTLPGGTSDAPAGTVIKVQEDANASLYTLPPDTALSRFVYQSKDFKGDLVPVSAYILWPFSPKSQPDG